MSLHDDVFLSTYLHPAYVLLRADGHQRWETTILKSVRLLHFSPRQGVDAMEEDEDNTAPLTNANKDLHRRWLLTGRRLAAQAAEDEGEEWTDEEGEE